jgi:hypothetical protein
MMTLEWKVSDTSRHHGLGDFIRDDGKAPVKAEWASGLIRIPDAVWASGDTSRG